MLRSLVGSEMCIRDSFNGTKAYAKAKRIQTIIVSEQTDNSDGPLQVAVHPGWVDTPGLQKLLPRFYKLLKPTLRTPEEGIDTLLWLCTVDPNEIQNGSLYHDRSTRSTTYLPGTATSLEDAQKIYNVVESRASELIK